ncbi:MAG: transglutaminase domain-containing protein [Planctomycetes bacterium]|nr:transglutaminase domain-containing protein [Planctomycetota bacterium]
MTGTYSFEISTQHMTVERWTIFAAEAPRFTWQYNATTQLLPEGKTAEDFSDRHRHLLQSDAIVKSGERQHRFRGEVVVTAQLRGRRLVQRKPEVKYYAPGELSGSELEHSLAATPTVDFTREEFRHWQVKHGLTRHAGEDTIGFARRVFLHLRKSLTYEYHTKMDRSAQHVCQAGVSDCAGMSALFVACLRANKVPARMIAGHWAKSTDAKVLMDGKVYNQQHVKAEFFVVDVGWIPVDVSSGVQRDHSEHGLEYFGWSGADFFTMHLDYDLEVDVPRQGRKKLDELQSFHYYVWGVGKLDDAEITSTWTVTEDVHEKTRAAE